MREREENKKGGWKKKANRDSSGRKKKGVRDATRRDRDHAARALLLLLLRRTNLEVVLLRGLEVSLLLELAGEAQVGIVQQRGAVRRDQPDHVLVEACLAVEVDGLVGLPDRQVELLGLLVLALTLQLERLGHVEGPHVPGGHVGHRQGVGLVPE